MAFLEAAGVGELETQASALGIAAGGGGTSE